MIRHQVAFSTINHDHIYFSIFIFLSYTEGKLLLLCSWFCRTKAKKCFSLTGNQHLISNPPPARKWQKKWISSLLWIISKNLDNNIHFLDFLFAIPGRLRKETLLLFYLTFQSTWKALLPNFPSHRRNTLFQQVWTEMKKKQVSNPNFFSFFTLNPLFKKSLHPWSPKRWAGE